MVTRARTAFTVDEANRSLPLVRSIVADVATLWKELVKAREHFGNSSPEHDRLLRELAENIQELHEIGCHVRDFATGTVDFPAIVSGRERCLTWRLGEDCVRDDAPRPARRADTDAEADAAGLEAAE